MTKFILHGGTSHRTLEQMQDLFDEVVRGHKKSMRILLIFFAKSETDWPGVFEFVKGGFEATAHSVKLEIASLNPDKFQKQWQTTDAVFVYGGETDLLLETLKKIDPKGNIFRVPVFAGSSAGAHILSKWYYRRSKGGVQKGMGILPIKLLVHYKSHNVDRDIDWVKVEDEMRAVGDDLPIYKIGEGEQKIIEQGK